MLLGCIADDITGATDLALNLVRNGMKTIQVSGVPEGDVDFSNVDAVVVALKSRTIPVDEAVEQSRAALAVLSQAGAKQFYFKYCSTFDSTDKGNIGPVIEALKADLKASVVIACPAFPETGRSVYQGHLFVESRLLSESPLKDHPLTPMNDPDLVRVLQKQMKDKVALLPWQIVSQGEAAIQDELNRHDQDAAVFIADAITHEDLHALGAACSEHALVTGGSGMAIGLPENFRKSGQLQAKNPVVDFRYPRGKTAILAGSCSLATSGQIEYAKKNGFPVLQLDPLVLAKDDGEINKVCRWLEKIIASQELPPIVYSTAVPDDVAEIKAALGDIDVGEMIEQTHGRIAQFLYEIGVSKLIVAGGETSGAVVDALGVKQLEIGVEIAPGVPWTLSRADKLLALALKSGNFGGENFFVKAWEMTW